MTTKSWNEIKQEQLTQKQFEDIEHRIAQGQLEIEHSEALQKAVDVLAKAKRVVAFVGAGMSQESGLRTFRGSEGLYEDEDEPSGLYMKDLREKPEETLDTLNRWKALMDEAQPNNGHRALVHLVTKKPIAIITQNIDGLTVEAALEVGPPAIDVPYFPIHGRFNQSRCNKCFQVVAQEWGDDCAICGGLVRPDVVLFDEPLDDSLFAAAEKICRSADVVMLLGTSGMVFPAASLPEYAAQEGATLIEINPEQTGLSDICDVTVREKMGEALPAIVFSL